MSGDFMVDWQRCPDGVSIQEIPSPTRSAGRRTVLHTVGGGSFFVYNSNTRLPDRYAIGDKQREPLITLFANCRDDEDLCEFFDRYGLIGARGDDKLSRDEALEARDKFRQELSWAKRALRDGKFERASDLLEMNPRAIAGMGLVKGSRGQPPRLVLEAQSLEFFMLVELAVYLSHGATVLNCKHCNSFFIAGGGGVGKRVVSESCSRSCKQAAYRERKKAEAERLKRAKTAASRRKKSKSP